MAELSDPELATEAPVSAAQTRFFPPPVRGMRAAFVFLSRLPLGGFPYRDEDWRWAPAHFPLVGACIGAGSGLIYWLADALSLGPLLGASLAVATSVWLTGAFHEDGLADSADGLGGGRGDRQRTLEIMKDSRIGTYGAVALMLSLLVRVLAIAELSPSAWLTLVYVHCVARVGPVWLMATERYASDPRTGKSPGLFATRPVHVAAAVAWCGLCTAGVIADGWPWPRAAVVTLVVGAVTLACARYFRRAVGGVTGDLLGASEQLCEVAAWVALLATLRL